jgi:GT2 family glycosyltransferase
MGDPLAEGPAVSVIVVTYKRVQHLTQTLSSLLKTATYPRSQLELILCDDGSPADIQGSMRELPCDRFLLSKKNAGMGSNANKGLREATGEYILHLQDDWRCVGPPDFIEASLEVFRERPEVGFIRLRNAFDGPYEEHITATGRIVHIYFNRKERRQSAGEYLYTDNPHIKRKTIH